MEELELQGMKSDNKEIISGFGGKLHPERFTQHAQSGFVKTASFERTIAFLAMLTEILTEAASKYKSFRVELEYDAEALNTYYAVSVPMQSDGDCRTVESQEH